MPVPGLGNRTKARAADGGAVTMEMIYEIKGFLAIAFLAGAYFGFFGVLGLMFFFAWLDVRHIEVTE